MLKLINASEIDYKHVLNYCCSFDRLEDINTNAIVMSLFGKDKYNEYIYDNYINNNDCNLYYLIDTDKPDYIIGYCSIDFSNDLPHYGNIGGGIRPKERGNGYGKLILQMGVNKSFESGYKEVFVSCLEDNIVSKNIIEEFNGIFMDKYYDKNEDKYVLKYKFLSRIKDNIKIKKRAK